jgi:hypothetical protein
MLKNIHLLVILMILLSTGDLSESTKEQVECLLENNKYSDEFLYSNRVNHVFTISFHNMNMLKWTLTQLTGAFDQYTIRYVTTNEYLCATDFFEESLQLQDITNDVIKKRLIHTRKMSDKNTKIDDDCIWRFERTHTDKGFMAYFIWNVYYNESLYAASYLYLNPNKKLRKTFLLNKMSKKMNEFKWIPECNY